MVTGYKHKSLSSGPQTKISTGLQGIIFFLASISWPKSTWFPCRMSATSGNPSLKYHSISQTELDDYSSIPSIEADQRLSENVPGH